MQISRRRSETPDFTAEMARPKRGGDGLKNTLKFLKNFSLLPRL
jgi:hypothetical protein